MQYGNGTEPGQLLILHGGAGPMDSSRGKLSRAVDSLLTIGRKAGAKLEDGVEPKRVVTYCLELMEADPQFNAGVGGALQADGVPRLSAALMDGSRQRFSGVVNATYLSHPSQLSLELQRRRTRVLTAPGVELLARQLRLPVASNLTERTSDRWLGQLRQEDFESLATGPSSASEGFDTVGCILRTAEGAFHVGASTGGRGFEYPGRVSDTCTVAGTYASRFAAIAVTGRGEEIVDDAVAARLETRVRDGMSLVEASDLCLQEARKRKRQYGWIAASSAQWAAARTTARMAYVVLGGTRFKRRIAESERA